MRTSTSHEPMRPVPRSRLARPMSAAVTVLLAAAALTPIASADTGPILTGIQPNAVSATGGPALLLIEGTGFDTSWSLRWRGADYPLELAFDAETDSAVCCTATIPGAALSIADPFLTVAAFLARDGASSNAQPVTILGAGAVSGSSALANAGETVTVTTDLVSARYSRAAAGSGIVTAVDYTSQPDPNLPPSPILPPNPVVPHVSALAYLDLQVQGAGFGDTLAGTFLPPSPILPPNPVLPPNPILPPNPVRLAYWTGASWAPVLGSGGVAPTFAFDYATTTASAATVTFDDTSAPQITALTGTVFAYVASYAFVGFEQPVDNEAVNTARAGRTIPLKWRVLDLGGNPVSDLDPSAVAVRSASVPCASLVGADSPLDAYASGASGLQNLGDGYYQVNWSTTKAWAGSCRRLSVELGDAGPTGLPISHAVNFEFRP